MRRIVAHGFRNPFRLTLRPGTNEVWVGDVGWNDWEEINRITSPTGSVSNAGWPCYEGPEVQLAYQNTGLNICTNLYNAGSGAVDLPVLRVHPQRAGRVGRDVPRRQLVHLGAGLLPGRQLPELLQRGALLRRLLAQVHLGHDAGVERPSESRPQSWRSTREQQGPSTSRSAPAATSSTRTSTPERSGESSTSEAADPPPPSGTSYLSDLTCDLDDERLRADREGQEQRRLRRRRRAHDHAQRHDLPQGAGRARRFRRAVLPRRHVQPLQGLGRRRRRGARANGSVVFQVFADATKVYDSALMTGATATKTVDVSVAGATDAAPGRHRRRRRDQLRPRRLGARAGRLRRRRRDTTPPTITARTPAGRCDRRRALDQPDGDLLGGDQPEHADDHHLHPASSRAPRPRSRRASPTTIRRARRRSPRAPTLEASTSYTATVKGGASGVKDLAGNALAADVELELHDRHGRDRPRTLPERPHLDLDDERLRAGREGQEQRRLRRRRRAHDHAQRHDLRQGPGRACRLRHPVRAREHLHPLQGLGRRRRRGRRQRLGRLPGVRGRDQGVRQRR